MEVNCTSLPAKVLTVHKTTTAVQDIKAIQEIVRRTSSEKKSYGKIVLNRIFAVTAMFYEDITAFMELIQKQRFDEAEKDMKRKRREVEQARKRIAELDRIFKRIYEDDIRGAISHERFFEAFRRV
mgnify:CR=1 FL=1